METMVNNALAYTEQYKEYLKQYTITGTKRYNTMYRDTHSLVERRIAAKKVLDKYPDRVPVIIEASTDLNPEMKSVKFLIYSDITMSEFIYIIRNRIGKSLHPGQAIFLFTERNTLPPSSEMMNHIYEDHKNEDGMLYLKLDLETTYG